MNDAVTNRTELLWTMKISVEAGADAHIVYCKSEALCRLGEAAAKRMYPDEDIRFTLPPRETLPNEKVYLGDGAYAEFESGTYCQIVLTTEDGVSVQNRVVLGINEVNALHEFIQRHFDTKGARP